MSLTERSLDELERADSLQIRSCREVSRAVYPDAAIELQVSFMVRLEIDTTCRGVLAA
jgi:hypothetical protein